MRYLERIGHNLKSARKKRFPKDDLQDFSVRIGVARATLQKMEKGDLSVSIEKYYRAAEVLEIKESFNKLFEIEKSMFDD
ncbi:MAG: helix-turn-helix transcriptional regulator [Pseudomonadota bacterium]